MSSCTWIRKNSMYRISRAAGLVLCLCIFLLPRACGSASLNNDPEGSFRKAAIYYENGEYDKAITEYKTILDAGLKSGEIYYNIGNAYLKKGETGKAVLNYKRASIFIPRDSALLINYRYAVSQMKQRDSNPKKPALLKILNGAFEFFSPGEMMAVFMLVYYAWASLVVISKIKRKKPFVMKFAKFLLFILVISVVIPLYSKVDEAERGAIVISGITDVKFEPLENALPVFPLYEGMKVCILKSKKGWDKIMRPDGKIGWMKNDSLEAIRK